MNSASQEDIAVGDTDTATIGRDAWLLQAAELWKLVIIELHLYWHAGRINLVGGQARAMACTLSRISLHVVSLHRGDAIVAIGER